MAELVWDQTGERRYEMGVDRGVLYHPDYGAHPWNGLISVTEDKAREVKEYYLDGFKYLEQHLADTYSGRIQAYTYPDVLESLIGVGEHAPGVFVHDQSSKMFGLSYRTRIGNDVSDEHGYKIHLLYNVRAVPSNTTHNTISGGFNATTMEFSLSGMPLMIEGRNPTNHISLNSRFIDDTLLAALEDLLYGTEATAAGLPPIEDVLALAD